MTKLRFALTLALLATGACAKQQFSSRWRLAPTLEPAHAELGDYDRQEIERRQEVGLLVAERADLAQILREDHSVFAIEAPGLFDAPAQMRDVKDIERRDLAAGLKRIITLSRRINFLTGRDESEDPVITRAVARLREVLKRPLPDAYYGH